MMPSIRFRRRRVLIAGAVFAAVAAAAIFGVFITSQESTDSVGSNASERVAAIDGVEAMVTTTVVRGDSINRTVRRVKMRPNDGKMRSEFVDASAPSPELVVSNGTTTWRYDSNRGTVRRTNTPTQQTIKGDRIERLFKQTQADEAADSTTDWSVAPLPAVPPGRETPSQPPASVTDPNRTYNVSYEGTGTVDDRRVHILQITAVDNGTGEYRNFSQRLWIDAEWFMPLQYRTSWISAGDPVEVRVEYANVTFNPGLSSETFTFDMPADAALVTPDLGTDAADRLDALEGLSAKTTTRITGFDFNETSGGNDTYRTVQRVRYRFETGEQRSEILTESEGPSTVGTDLIVANGTTMWVYDDDANNVTILRVDTTGQFDQRGERTEQLFARLNQTRTTPDEEPVSVPSPGLSPVAGLGPTGQAGVSSPTTEPNRYGVSFGGVETVDGRPAYVLEIESTDTSGNTSTNLRNYSQTMWLDAEYFFPLRQQSQFDSGNDTITSVTTYSNVSINPEFDDGLFEFEPPANATVSTMNTSFGQSYRNRSAIEATAPVPVPEPSVPRDFELSQGQTSSSEFADRVSLVYTNETSELRVTVYDFNQSFSGNGSSNTTGEAVDLGGQTGTYTRSGLSQSVSWSCNGLEYSVSGEAVSRSLLVEIARSIECRPAS
jgi:outer membrane lipoprotein-sorting protein